LKKKPHTEEPRGEHRETQKSDRIAEKYGESKQLTEKQLPCLLCSPWWEGKPRLPPQVKPGSYCDRLAELALGQ
jgi:hypothetical protein